VRLKAVRVAAPDGTAHRFRVAWVPTLVLFVEGHEVARWEGARTVADLMIEIQTTLADAKSPHLGGDKIPPGTDGAWPPPAGPTPREPTP
jgi:thioredoxin-like negative regulator of GroEL